GSNTAYNVPNFKRDVSWTEYIQAGWWYERRIFGREIAGEFRHWCITFLGSERTGLRAKSCICNTSIFTKICRTSCQHIQSNTREQRYFRNHYLVNRYSLNPASFQCTESPGVALAFFSWL